MSQTTKRALGESLKKLLVHKSLDKITVSDITEDCAVNRQTFYYHFRDIYDLIEWIYLNEAARALDGKKTYDTWQQGFRQLFDYALRNREFVESTYHSISREHLEAYLDREVDGLMRGVIGELSKGKPMRENDSAFMARFYTYAFVGLMLDWIRGGMKTDPDDIISRLDTLLRGTIAEAIERFRTDT